MSEIQETGVGSPAGKRWFVSSKYPHLNVCIRSAEDKTPTARAIKGIYALFQNAGKPESFHGDGKPGSHNFSGTDINDSPYWGIFEVEDPGSESEIEKEKNDSKRAKLSLARLTVDKLRACHFYKQTAQNNEVSRHSQLVELNWDPSSLSGAVRGLVGRGREALDKTSVGKAAAPSETRTAPPAAKVPSLSRKTVAAV